MVKLNDVIGHALALLAGYAVQADRVLVQKLPKEHGLTLDEFLANMRKAAVSGKDVLACEMVETVVAAARGIV